MKKLLCIILNHKFAGWDTVPNEPLGSLGMAHCARCGREF